MKIYFLGDKNKTKSYLIMNTNIKNNSILRYVIFHSHLLTAQN